jgi:hypothetical protein
MKKNKENHIRDIKSLGVCTWKLKPVRNYNVAYSIQLGCSGTKKGSRPKEEKNRNNANHCKNSHSSGIGI